MAKTGRKTAKRAGKAGRGRVQALKSSVSKARKNRLHIPESTKTKPGKPKPSHQPETARLKGQLKTARMQQEASAEILHAVANASGDAAGPLQLIAETTARLFGASSVSIQLAEGSEFTQEYRVGAIARRIGSAYPRSNIKVGGRNLPGTVVGESRQIHIPDLDRLDPSMSDFPGLPHARAGGARTVCGTPLRREHEAIGALIVFRDRLLPFTGDELALLQSFADQAVIAIRNARLFNETREALERQVATADILRIISRSVAHAAPVFDTILESCQRLFNPYDAAVYLVEGDRVRGVARRGPGVGDWGVDSMPLAGSSTGLAITQQRPLHFPDLADKAGLPEDKRDAVRLAGGMSVLYAPIISESRGVGSLVVTRQPKKPFTETEVEFIQSFADQAAIAIENARLFNEVGAKTRDLTDSLQQQTATADVLKVISRSAFDLDAVMHTLAHSAAELCAAGLCGLYIREGDFLVCRGYTAVSKEQEEFVRQARIPANDPNFATTRVLSSGEMANIGDFKNDRSVATQAFQEKLRFKSLLIIPLMREGQGIGLFVLGRDRVGQFSPRHVELVQTFADQAVIAIENARLFDEVQARTRDLGEALTYQTGSANILNVIASSPTDVAPVLKAIVESACEVCEAYDAAVLLRDGDDLRFSAHHGPIPIGLTKWPINRRWTAGRAFIDQQPVHIEDLRDEKHAEFSDGRELSLRMGHRTIASVPLLRDKESVGAIVLRRVEVHPFSSKQIALLQTFADQAVIALGNVRLFEEVQAKSRDLEESLQQQIATADVLKVISRSAFDLQTVLETLARSAVELSSARRGTVFLRDGDVFRFRAASHPDLNGDWIRFMQDNPQLAGRHSTIGRAIASARSVCTPDVEGDPEIRMPTYLAGIRAVLAVPLLRDGKVEGVMALSRQEPGEFTARQIELVETFADQAVIAIENTRLFNETKEALAYQTGSSNVLKVIASSPTDVEPVLKEIVESARELCEANDAVVLLKDAEHLRFSAHSGPIPVTLDKWPISRNWTAGRAFVDQKPIHVHDMLSGEGAEFPDARAMGQSTGSTIHTVLSVPLLRGNESIGAILLRRAEVRPFNDKQINLLSTFADQAVIAIQNARLFNETREALEQQKASADILGVISNSVAETQPVFDEILRSVARLFGTQENYIFLAGDDDLLHVGAGSGPRVEEVRALFPVPLDGTVSQVAIRERRLVNSADVFNDLELPSPAREGYRRLGENYSMVVAPMLREERAIGSIMVARTSMVPFSEKECSLLRTFADQAVIAIQNARMFGEVQAKTAELTESLQQQTATSEILRVISQSPTDVQPVFEAIALAAVQLLGCERAFIQRCDGASFWTVVWCGPEGQLPILNASPIPIDPEANFPSRAISEKRTLHLPDWSAIELPEFEHGIQERLGINSALYMPLLREGECIGLLAMAGKRTNIFGANEITLAESFRDQALIAIENTRLFNETKEALERQTATADILKVIATSPSDLQPVFEAIAERSNRLVSGLSTTVLSIVDDTIHLSAFTRTNPEADAALTASFPRQLSTTPFGESIRQGAVYSLPDTETEPALRDLARMRGYRSMLFVPLLRDGAPIGMIGQTRVEPGPFAVHHIQLLKTFADQAVIAISNVRLFQEVRKRTRELSQSLDDLRTAQDRLVQTEKLASLGQLTAGIAHEIKNPLNFVNNFSALSVELIDEMTDIFENPALDEAGRRKELDEIRELLKSNLEKVVQHGKRADSIVKNMLLHSREGSGEQRAVDINALLDESLNLAYHGARAEKPGFNITLQRDLDPDAGAIELFPQEITRALLNLISNGFYAASKRGADNGEANFEPVLSAATKNLGSHIEIRIRDNGTGIPPEVKEKMFNPFFTTKPAGEGTGLGLSMSHDIIVKQHGGRIEVDTQPGQFTEFTIVLPRANNRKN